MSVKGNIVSSQEVFSGKLMCVSSEASLSTFYIALTSVDTQDFIQKDKDC